MAHESADGLWKRLTEAGDGCRSRAEAMGRNTPGQFERARAWIRDYLREQEGAGPLRRLARDEEFRDEGW
ncbi:hypothetical protein [Streptomyces sp. NPDC059802]|uniref:hypothetical protein n=1 Tax=Streptomyces sp. NPDC059802 TaxID=3346952 RepID=UPI003649ED31